MTDWKKYFAGRRVLVMGLGLLGRQINVVKFLVRQGAEVTVTDLKNKNELRPALEELEGLEGVNYVLGKHRLKDFRSADMVIRGANIPLGSPYLAEARSKGVPVKMDSSLFLELAPEGVISVGVTGTRGKSTVTHMIAGGLEEAGRKVFLGGNIRGVATLPLLERVSSGDYVVLELDSWQLQGFGESRISPRVAVFTTFMRDHMNYYGNDTEQYLEDKANIFQFQTPEDHLILGRQCAERVREKYPFIASQIIVIGRGELPSSWRLKIPGNHNKYNAALAMAALDICGVKRKMIKKSLENFAGVPGRLEYLGKVQQVRFYNDNNATTPDAVLAALSALEKYKGKIILIGGGADKELDFTEYGREVPQYLKKLILLEGEASVKMEKVLPQEMRLETVDSVKEAMERAWQSAEPGDVVLFSPGASSFNMFRNEYERNDRFLELFHQLSN